jgi:uncharacterized protein (DUF885 family)
MAMHGSLGLALISSLLVLGIMVPVARAADADEALQKYFQKYLDESFRMRPTDATRAGDHRFDHLLDDVSPAARKGWAAHTRATLDELPKQVDYARLSRSGQIDYEIFKHSLTYDLWQAENLHRFEEDPRAFGELISESVFLLLTQSTQPKATNIKNAAARMAQIPKVVQAARESLKNPPKPILETAIRQNRGAIDFYEHGLFELAGETPQLSELGPVAKTVVASLKDHQKFLEELLPKTTGDWRLGKERFARKLEQELDAGLSAEEVLQEAETEFKRVERDMYIIARQLWGQTFPKKPLPPDDEAGRRATIRQVLAELVKDHGKPEDLVQDARATVIKIKEFIRDHDILRLPDPDRCQIIEMPEFQRGNSLAYLSPAPPLDPKASSIYAVSPPPKDWDDRRVASFLEEYNRSMLQILTIHEAYPGHYVQLEYANRYPSIIRRVLWSGVFAEGWAVYTEQTMLDQGYGKGDLPLRLNQLKFYLRAVGNAILDHKMHCTQMTDEEALAFLTERAFQSEGEAKLKVIRAKQSSCQLSTYFVGRTAFYRLRQTIQREQGDDFQLGPFHEAVLDHGTLPVKYLPELVRERLKKPR